MARVSLRRSLLLINRHCSIEKEKELVSPPSGLEAKLSHSSTPDSKSDFQNQADSNLGFSLPKIYDASVEELKRQDLWGRRDLYKFDCADSSKPTDSYDITPPYPSEDGHV